MKAEDTVLDIGRERQLFVDHYLIDRMSGAQLVMHEPRYEGEVLRFDRPWEGAFSGYTSVVKDGDTYRLYYRGLPRIEHGTGLEVLCYAESSDGVHWVRPNLGMVEVQGTRENNVLIADSAPGTHSFAPFIDTKPDVPPAQRYKALGYGVTAGKERGLLGFASADGIHWKTIQEEPVIINDTGNSAFDSQNIAFWSVSEGQYVAYFRSWKDGVRTISRTTSPDFLHWSPSSFIEYRHGDGLAPDEQLYTNQTQPYFRAPQIYIALAARFMPGRQVLSEEQACKLDVHPKYFKDTSDVVLMTTRPPSPRLQGACGGTCYDRTFLESFIRPGLSPRNWVSRSNYAALGVVQTGAEEMSIYVNRDYSQPTAHLARYSLRLDGFASVRAPYQGGELLTNPFCFQGSELSLNISTSAGSVRVEIQGADGKPMAGYALDDCREIIGDEIERVVSWEKGNNLARLAGTVIRLRFVMKDANLYSFCFQ